MSELPSGTVTFLFSDIEDSTLLVRRLGDGYAQVLDAHRTILRQAFAAHGGREIDAQGDSMFVAFATAHDALRAAIEGQAGLAGHAWPRGGAVRVRMGLHTAEPALRDGAYVGLGVHRAARICAAAHGGQILVSSATRSVLVDRAEPGLRLRDLGSHRLKGLGRPERLYHAAAPPEPARSRRALSVARGGRRVTAALAAVATLAFGAGVVVSVTGRSGTAEALTRVDANAVGAIDPATNRVRSQIPVGEAPGRLAVGAGALWVANTDDDTVSRIEMGSRAVQSVKVGHGPAGIAFGAGAVWVTNGFGRTVSRIDPDLARVTATITVGNGPSDVLVTAGSVWVANADDHTISRIDPDTDRVRAHLDVTASGLAYGEGALWATDRFAERLRRIDPGTGRVTGEAGVGNGPTAVVVADGAVWVANTLDGTVSRIDPQAIKVTATTRVGDGPVALAAGAGSVWAAGEFGATVARLDPTTGLVDHTVSVGHRPQGLAVAGGAVWVGVRASGAGHRGGTLTVIGGTEPYRRYLDPAIAYIADMWAVLSTAGGGLTTFKRVGGSAGAQLVPDVARAIPSALDGGRTYTFSLRRGIRYSTGQPLRPSDFRRGFERAFALGRYSPVPSLFDKLRGAAACRRDARRCDLSSAIVTDDRAGTVTFQLIASDPEFLFKLARPFAYPVPPGTAAPPAVVPGVGPYRIARVQNGHDILLVRNPYFRSWSQAAAPDGYPDRIVVRDVPPGRGLRAVELGRADLIGPPFGDVPGDLSDLPRRYPRQLRITPTASVSYVALNTRVPPFNDVRVRRALNEAVDRDAVARLAGGRDAARSTCQVIPADFPGYRPYCPYHHDTARARALVAASGTAGLPVTVWAYPKHAPLGRYIVRVLGNLGYRARLRVSIHDYDQMKDSHNRTQVDISGWQADFPAAATFFQTLLTCRSFVPNTTDNTNIFEFCDRRVDARIAAADALQSASARGADEAWARVDRAVVDAAPLVALFNPLDVDLISSRVGNYQKAPAGPGALLDQLWVR
jgi:YVTN family beta-propeller protein